MSSAAGFSMEIGSCLGIRRAVLSMDQFNGGGSLVLLPIAFPAITLPLPRLFS